MTGHRKHIAVAVALASAATIGIAPRPPAGVALLDQVVVERSTPAAQVGSPKIDTATPEIVVAALSKPHVIDDAVADVLVRVLGSVCTGTPITGTVYVVTAAHCVLTPRGRVIQRTVERDGVRYRSIAVLVDTDYADHPREEVDAAVLVMTEEIPGPSVRIGSALPDRGEVTLAGFQPIDSDGTLLRGHRLNDRLASNGAPPHAPAGCAESVRSLQTSATRVMVPCGLVPGASGGGLFTEVDGELVLVGILSTVTSDLSANGIVPLASLQKLVDHPGRYGHGF